MIKVSTLRLAFSTALLAAAGVASGLMPGIASASSMHQNWPLSVVGTWKAVADVSALNVTIASQSTGGKCQTISGSILDQLTQTTQPLSGFYCPYSGYLHFHRDSAATGLTYQDFTGNLSDSYAGTTVIMAGHYDDFQGGTYAGSYAWYGTK